MVLLPGVIDIFHAVHNRSPCDVRHGLQSVGMGSNHAWLHWTGKSELWVLLQPLCTQVEISILDIELLGTRDDLVYSG